ncbi:hypothetical protein [Intestinibacter sp.]|uniref:hypothetical protein n=1 Tax=Intestinibacter sp. TaxID=1965304 RepID=UPI00307DFDBD
MKNTKLHFTVDYNKYKELKDERIGSKFDFDEKSLIQFMVRLPYYIPIQDETVLNIYGSENYICTFLFKSINLEKPLFSVANKDDSLFADKKYTLVESIYITNKVLDNDEKVMNEIFDKLIETLNDIILSIIIKTKNTKIYRVNVQMLEPCSLYRIINLKSGEESESGLFLLNHNVEIEEELITLQEIPEILSLYKNVIENKVNLFITSEEIMMRTLRYRDDGFNKECIILAQLSVESFIRTLYREFLLNEGNDEITIEKEMNDVPFMSIVKKEMSKRIGGKWNIKGYGDVGNWYRDTYLKRNRVIHGGFEPSLEEGELAVQRAIQIRSYIINLLKNKSKQYPDIVRYFIYK